MKIISWNINGIRAIEKKGFIDWLQKEQPDILGLQEIKAMPEQLSENLLSPEGYHSFFNPAQRKGYSGTATYSKTKPLNVVNGIGESKFDEEGRVLITEFKDFSLFNIYFPNGKMSRERLQYKLDFYDKCLEVFDQYVKNGKNIIVMGDYNTAHNPIDLARPQENENISGFLKIERDWLNKIVDHGYIDCFRHFNKEPDNYTWWSMRTRARERNVGWRIDYFFTNKNFVSELKNCYHLNDILGSDHCPIVLELR